MACTYTYRGYTYTRSEMLNEIKWGGFTNEARIAKARQWLKDKLDMDEHQVQVVKGLIDGKSFGRLQKDGNILLSSVFEEGTEYHEAFHRVFRFYLTPEQRMDLVDEFTQRDNWESLLAETKKLYPDKSEQVQIEEYLAEEFREFVIADGQFSLPNSPKTETWFRKLLNFLKKALGIETNMTTKELYERINAGKYKGKPNVSYVTSTADKIVLNGTELDTTTKRELTSHISTSLLSTIFLPRDHRGELIPVADRVSFYDYIANPQDITGELVKVIGGTAQALAEDGHEDLANDMFEDAFSEEVNEATGLPYLKSTSKLVRAVEDYFNVLGVKLDFAEEANDSVDKEEHIQARDYAFTKVAFEFDPKSNMSVSIKLMLASLSNEEFSPNLGLIEPLRWNEVANQITDKLAGQTPTIANFIKVLREHSTDRPYFNDLIDILGGDELTAKNYSYNISRLRTEFVQAFAKTKYNFLIGQAKGNNVYYADMNTNSLVNKIFQEWKNDLINEYETMDELIEALGQLDTGHADYAYRVADVMGFKELAVRTPETVGIMTGLADRNAESEQTVESVMRDIAVAVGRTKGKGISVDNILGDLQGEHAKLGIRGSVRKVAEAVIPIKDVVSLVMFNTERKKRYSISLNTYQTMIIDELNVMASQPTVEERWSYMQDNLAHLLNVGTVKILDDGTRWWHSAWLEAMVEEGVQMKMNLLDGAKAEGREGKTYSDLKETDLLAFTINGHLNNVNASMKHSDRSSFFAYSLGKMSRDKLLVGDTTYRATLESGTNRLRKHLYSELLRIKAFNEGLGKDVGRYNKNGGEFTIFSYLTDDLKKKLLKGEVSYEKTLQATGEINKYLGQETTKLVKLMKEWGLVTNDGVRIAGLDNKLWEKYGSNVLNYASAATANSILNHIEETKVLTGDLAFYKNAEDAYKRFSMQSSTGEVLIVDQETNDFIDYINSRDSFTVANPRGGSDTVQHYKKGLNDGQITEIVINENEDIVSYNIDTYEKLFQEGLERDVLPELEARLGKVKAKAEVAKRVKNYTDAFRQVNENDGMSWINIFFWREMEHRAGEWSQAKENIFQVEMAALNVTSYEELAEMEVWMAKEDATVNGGFVEQGSISATERPGYSKKVKVFDLSEKVYNKMDAYKLMSEFFNSGAPKKPQYTGPMYDRPKSEWTEQAPESRLNVIAGRKTAYHILAPTSIIGTKFQAMNAMMLRNNLDVIHMGSAAKYGYLDPKKSMENYYDRLADEAETEEDLNNLLKEMESNDIYQRGVEFYDLNGDINERNIEKALPAITTYLDAKYMKNQLRITGKEKQKIKNSTQSMKILLSNIMVNGVPKDYEGSSWEKLSEEGREARSELYSLKKKYETALRESILRNIDKLDKELAVKEDGSVGKTDELVRILRSSAEERKEPIVILDAIEHFANNPTLELLPNKNRIENILHAIVSSRIINFKRQGNAVPQIATSGMEGLGANRAYKDGKLVTSADAMKFHELREDGGLTPAEVIMPFPKKWLPKLMKTAGTTNMVSAINWLNDKLADESEGDIADAFTFKGLRIPNQQLSSNPVIKVKKFLLPSITNYVFVPAEVVTTTGGDFDVDKLSIYFPHITFGKGTIRKKVVNSERKRYEEYIMERAEDRSTVAIEKKEQLKKARSEMSRMIQNGKAVGGGAASINRKNERLKKSKGDMFKSYLDDAFLTNEVLGRTIASMNKELKANKVDKLSERLTEISIRLAELANDAQSEDVAEMYTDWSREAYDLITTEWKPGESIATAENYKHEALQKYRDKAYAKLDGALSYIDDVAKDIGEISYEEFQALPLSRRKTNKEVENDLLQSEIDLLTHKLNSHTAIAPLVDDILSKDAVAEIITKLKGTSLDKTDYHEAYGIWKNILKARHYVGGKFGVGQVATIITMLSVNQSDGMKLNLTYERKVDGEIETVSNRIPIEGAEELYDIGYINDTDGNNIMEVLSALLTSQVDVGKNPYPIELGINNQTLNPLTYLVVRGVPIITALKLLAQPMVKTFLDKQRVNESAVYEGTGNQQGKADFLKGFLQDQGISNDYTRALIDYNAGASEVITIDELNKGLRRSGARDKRTQAKFLALFNKLVDDSRVFSSYKRDLAADTKTLKDRAAYEATRENYQEMQDSKMIASEKYRQGVLSPFFTAREKYHDLFNNYYMFYNMPLAGYMNDMKKMFSGMQRGEGKERAINKIDNDFISYLLQNVHPDFKNITIEQLLTGTNSMAHVIKRIHDNPKDALHNNYVIKQLYPQMKNAAKSNKPDVHNIRLFSNEYNTIDLNDLHEAMMEVKEARPRLYKGLILANFYQAGISNSAYNFDKVIPFEDRVEMIELVLPTVKNINRQGMQRFFQLFQMNNPSLLPKFKGQFEKAHDNAGLGEEFRLNFKQGYSTSAKKTMLIDKDNNYLHPLGSPFFLDYKDSSSPKSHSELLAELSEEVDGIKEAAQKNKQAEIQVAIDNYNKEHDTSYSTVTELINATKPKVREDYPDYPEASVIAVAKGIVYGKLKLKC